MGQDDKGKIGSVKTTGIRGGVEKTGAVGEVEKAKEAAPVGKVAGAGSVKKRRATRVMSGSERQALFDLIAEEADKLFDKSTLPQEQREVVENAVKMAVDAAIIEEEEEEE